jgi:hypothetical protein
MASMKKGAPNFISMLVNEEYFVSM